jgi:integrase
MFHRCSGCNATLDKRRCPRCAHGLVVALENAEPGLPDRFSRDFQRDAAEAALPTIRLHDLRHTHASLLLASRISPKGRLGTTSTRRPPTAWLDDM